MAPPGRTAALPRGWRQPRPGRQRPIPSRPPERSAKAAGRTRRREGTARRRDRREVEPWSPPHGGTLRPVRPARPPHQRCLLELAKPWGSETRIRSRGGAVVLVDESTEQVPPANIARVDRDRDRNPGFGQR